MKKLISVILALTLSIALIACNLNNKTEIKNVSGNKIPNVFGIYYTDAVEVLEAEGFEVKAIETSVKSISDKLLYKLDSAEKGSVFKIDDYILDGNGHLTLNYEILHGNFEMFSEDNSIVVYYSKENYTNLPPAPASVNTSAYDNVEETVDNTMPQNDVHETADTTEKMPETKESNNEIRAEFKSAMDSYEKFFDEYVSIMKKYTNNPSDMSILSDYMKYIGEYDQMMEDFEKWENEEMNVAETAYFLEVQGRITKKLLEISQ